MAGDAPDTNDQSQNQATAPAASAAPPVEPMAPGADPDDPPQPLVSNHQIPTRKDISLRELLSKIDDSAPIIPDAVTHYYMTKSGLPPPPQTDPRLARLLALATQKFIADVAADAYQYSRIRASNSNANNPMGNLGAAAGFPIPGQPGGVAGGPGGMGSQGGVVGAGGAGGAGGGAGGKPGGLGVGQGPGGLPLGIQRPGFGGGGQGGTQNRTVLTMEDLGMAVGEYGVNIKRSEFYR